MIASRVVVLVTFAVVAVWAAVVLVTHGEPEVYCQPAAMLFEDGSGWSGGEDPDNNCAFTLYDAERNRLPPEAYVGTGFEPPPPIRQDLARRIPLIVLVLAVAGIAVTLVSTRRWATVHDEDVDG